MINLNDIEAIKKIDPQGTFESTEKLIEQCQRAWAEVETLKDLPVYERVKNIVFCGMGASMYGAIVTRAVLGRTMPYPSEIISDYHIPEYVDSNSVVVLTSYSGNTEEVLSCASEAKAKSAQMIVLTKGGLLAEFAKSNHIPSYIFDGSLNPAGIPRLGNGYTIIGLLALLTKLRVLDLEEREIGDALTRLAQNQKELKKKAQIDYEKFINKIPVIFAAEHLAGNAHILRNQFNETSKTFSCYNLIPDLNHHLMEGLQFPKNAPLFTLTLTSPIYEEKIEKRVELTADVVSKNHIPAYTFQASGATVYDDFLESMIYGSYLTLFLALYYGQNPAVNPWVDYFKEKLK